MLQGRWGIFPAAGIFPTPLGNIPGRVSKRCNSNRCNSKRSNSNSLISWLKRESYNSPHGPLGEQASLSSSSTSLVYAIPRSIRIAAKDEVEVQRFTVGASREREGACCFLSHIGNAGAGESSTGLDPN